MKHLVLLLFALMCCTSALAQRDSRYHYEGANSGTYGESRRRIQCSNCGEFYPAGVQHMCLKNEGSSSSSSSSSYPTDGSDVSDAVADGYLVGNPELLINQTGIKPQATTDEEEGESNSSQRKSKNDEDDDSWIWGLVIAGGLGLLWLKNR